MEAACGEKQCVKCMEIKPLTAFSPMAKGANGRHAYCKSCRNAQAQARAELGRRKDRQKRKPPRQEIWPRPLGEALLDVSARKWRGPVNKGVLRWVA